MIDGTGMCGGCRVTVGGKTKFVCVDGPEFDAHEVDWSQMLTRLGAYKNLEKEAHDRCHMEMSIQKLRNEQAAEGGTEAEGTRTEESKVR
jgi:ferredoxin--NADP+ reductase